jgi:hypothetical protein
MSFKALSILAGKNPFDTGKYPVPPLTRKYFENWLFRAARASWVDCLRFQVGFSSFLAKRGVSLR